MKKAIIDTNFIITCIKQKIDFLEELNLLGVKIFVPKEVVKELEKNKANLALSVLEKRKEFFEIIEIGKGHVDKKIIDFAKKNPEVLVATLDKEIQNSIKNKKVIITEKKRIKIF